MRLNSTDLSEIMVGSERDLCSLKNASLYITGGTGYIGCWILEALCCADKRYSLGLKITVLSRNPKRFGQLFPHLAQHSAMNFICGDVRSFKYPDGDFTHVIHAATDVIAPSSPIDTLSVTVDGTRRVLEFCKTKRIKDVLLLSSGAVYGKIPNHIERVSEDHCGAPSTASLNSAYGIGKIVTEWLGCAYSNTEEMSCKSARVFAQIGPYLPLDRQFAAGNFIWNVLKEQPFLIKGDGTAIRSYMYGSDLVVWLLAILIRGKACRAYNVGSDHAISIRDLAAAIATIANIQHPTFEILGRPNPDLPIDCYVPDITRAKEELGLKVTIPLEAAIARTIEWYRDYISTQPHR